MKTTPSQDAAAKRALAKFYETAGQGLAGIGDPAAPQFLSNAKKLRAQLKPREVTP